MPRNVSIDGSANGGGERFAQESVRTRYDMDVTLSTSKLAVERQDEDEGGHGKDSGTGLRGRSMEEERCSLLWTNCCVVCPPGRRIEPELEKAQRQGGLIFMNAEFLSVELLNLESEKCVFSATERVKGPGRLVRQYKRPRHEDLRSLYAIATAFAPPQAQNQDQTQAQRSRSGVSQHGAGASTRVVVSSRTAIATVTATGTVAAPPMPKPMPKIAPKHTSNPHPNSNSNSIPPVSAPSAVPPKPVSTASGGVKVMSTSLRSVGVLELYKYKYELGAVVVFSIFNRSSEKSSESSSIGTSIHDTPESVESAPKSQFNSKSKSNYSSNYSSISLKKPPFPVGSQGPPLLPLPLASHLALTRRSGSEDRDGPSKV
ncbi:hypothetical protein GALMADRAFT_1341284 [Galerina marginata CBS 339.88]|uniref:Uncharacterized protein n=1 Tax=Galerina marginata (strain CBS 339.88) TaxID=685588 RepID=A0A067SST0_GALM3|nr:hypothetical protein GALMADRAFT_1341284 [Galerina marginata CBS 339.88]